MRRSKLKFANVIVILLSSFMIHGQEGEKTMAWYGYGAQQECPIDEIKYMSIGLSLQVDQKVISRIAFNKMVRDKLSFDRDRFITGILVNNSSSTKTIPSEHGGLIMIMEAKDTSNLWHPIEFWLWSGCSVGDPGPLYLEKSHFVAFNVPIFQGSFKTKMRLKLRWKKDYLVYSEEFNGQVSLNKLYGGHGLATEYLVADDIYLERW